MENRWYNVIKGIFTGLKQQNSFRNEGLNEYKTNSD